MIEYIGYISAILTSFVFAPQMIKTIRTKSTDGVSLGTYIIFNLGILGWFLYGILQRDWPIIFANTITFIFCIFDTHPED